MRNTKKTIHFYPMNDDLGSFSPPPSSGVSSNIPLWLKSMPKYSGNHSKFVYEKENNLSARNCIPFLETFTSGYIFTLPCDIQVRRMGDGNPRITWGTSVPSAPVTVRTTAEYNHIPKMEGYDELAFNWLPIWSVITPPGYSCQFIHPINRIDLPFYTFGGILDTDKWGEAENHPFFLKENFEGIIPKGTPTVQVIPFKREDWKSKINDEMDGLYIKKIRERDSVLKGWYKKNAWSNKHYK